MPNYQEGKIYKLYNTINDDIYIGSTTQKLCERMRGHRSCINSQKMNDRPLYQAFREHGVDNFYIELIEKCPCNDKDELRRTEGNYIRKLKPSLNMLIAGRTPKEYYNEHKEHLSELHKQYCENNKEHISEQKKQYKEDNREPIKEQRKEYYENNKEHIKESTKQYYENNKEYKREKIKCECGCIVSRDCLSRHKRNAKHQTLMI